MPAEDSSDEDWLCVINVNLNSVFYVWVKEQNACIWRAKPGSFDRPRILQGFERHLAGSAGALIPVDRGPSAQTIPAMPKTLTVFEVRDGRDATVGSITVPRAAESDLKRHWKGPCGHPPRKPGFKLGPLPPMSREAILRGC